MNEVWRDIEAKAKAAGCTDEDLNQGVSRDEARLMQRPDILEAIKKSRERSDAGYEGAGRPIRRRPGHEPGE